MSGPADQDRRGNHAASRRGETDEEPSVGSLGPSPELEEALREAAAAVPDLGRPREAREAQPEAPVEEAEEGEAARLRAELAAAQDRLLRMQADFDNFRKRALRDREEVLHYGPQNLVKDLLAVVDNLGRAIVHARQSEGGDLQGLLQGVDLAWKGLEAVLSKHNVREIEALGRPFNPAIHEAMAQVADASVAPNTVVEVLQKGYQLFGRLIRPARVVVARAPEAEGAGGEASSGS